MGRQVEPGQGGGVGVEAQVVTGEDLGELVGLQLDGARGDQEAGADEVEEGTQGAEELGVGVGNVAALGVAGAQQGLDGLEFLEQTVVAAEGEVGEAGGHVGAVQMVAGALEEAGARHGEDVGRGRAAARGSGGRPGWPGGSRCSGPGPRSAGRGGRCARCRPR